MSAGGVCCNGREHIGHRVFAAITIDLSAVRKNQKIVSRAVQTGQEEPARLVLLQFPREVGTVAVHDSLASLQQRYLEMEILEDLDERFLEPRNLEPILDTTDQANGVDLRTDVFEQTADES